jgi:hypothetical protein
MLAMRHHNPQDNAAFPNIDETDAGNITANDQVCLDEIGNCLLRVRAHDRFGATLLHSHFPVENDETLLEEVRADLDAITLKPVRANTSGLFATNICFDDADSRSGEPQLVGLEFASSRALAGVSPVNNSDRNVLLLIRGILSSHGKTGRFGIRLLHDPLKLNGSVLLEACDPIHRILTCRSSREDDPALARSIPAVFCWEEVSRRKKVA